jgi:hypothetical protein
MPGGREEGRVGNFNVLSHNWFGGGARERGGGAGEGAWVRDRKGRKVTSYDWFNCTCEYS